MLLMHKDTPVIQFNDNFTQCQILYPDLVPYRLRNALHSVPEDQTDPAVRDSIVAGNLETLTSYFASRVLTLSRSNAKKIYAYLNLSQAQTDSARAKIAVRCQNASISDCYWVKRDNSKSVWKDMDLKHIPLNQIMQTIALHGQVPTIQGNARTPDIPNPEISNYGTSGMAWKREDGTTYLYKKNSRYGHDAQIEISVSRILDCFNVEHASYTPARDDVDNDMCKCPNLATDTLDMVSAEDIRIYCENNNLDFHAYVMEIDPEGVAKMCVMDYLIDNTDRHLTNWGFYMNADTGNILCCHPLIDHNHAFESDPNDADGILGYHEFGQSRKEAALKMLPVSNLQCIKPVTRDMFINDAHYRSFMQKAVELGLYRQKPLNLGQQLRQKLLHAKFDEFVPVRLTSFSPRNFLRMAEEDTRKYIEEKLQNQEGTDLLRQRFPELNTQENYKSMEEWMQESMAARDAINCPDRQTNTQAKSNMFLGE